MSSEERLAELETRLAFQEDGMQSLSDLIHLQQQQIERLRALCEALTERYQGLIEAQGADSGGDEAPPHY